MWLYGYSENRQPLTQPEVLQDISVDHALKTVTLEAHPHISTGAGLHASIHPCARPRRIHHERPLACASATCGQLGPLAAPVSRVVTFTGASTPT